MTKEELREKRNLVIENLNHAIAILGSDELYIDELEKENLYYKDIVEPNSSEWEEQGQRVVALEKENAELKERNRELLESCEGATMMYEDLCKAKNIIRMVIDFYNHKERFSFEKDLMKVEQFLKEVSE